MKTLYYPVVIASLLLLPTSRVLYASDEHNHPQADQHSAAEGHDHPTAGPHGGALIELGKEEYHAELNLDEKHNQLAIVLLDSEAKQTVPVDAPYILVNVKGGDKPRQYRLPPAYPKGQDRGPATTFALVSPELMTDLHTPGVSAKMTVKIGKKSYAAALQHEHQDHTGHNHSNDSKENTSQRRSTLSGPRGVNHPPSRTPTLPWAKSASTR